MTLVTVTVTKEMEVVADNESAAVNEVIDYVYADPMDFLNGAEWDVMFKDDGDKESVLP